MAKGVVKRMDLYRQTPGNAIVKLNPNQAAAFIAGGGLVERKTIEGVVYHLVTTPERDAEMRASAAAYVPETKLVPLYPLQMRLVLLGAGFTPAQVVAAIETIPDPMQREIALTSWEYASQFERHHPLIEMVGAVMGFTTEQIDALWLQAMAINN